MGIEGKADDLHFVTFQSVISLTGLSVPDLGFSVERPGHDLVAVRVVKGHGIDNVGVLVEREQLVAGVGVPYLAGSVV